MAGTLTTASLEVNPTISPPESAGEESATLHEAWPAELMVAGVQFRLVIVGEEASVIVPEFPVTATAAALRLAPIALSTTIAAELAGTTVSTAISPFGIVLVFSPQAIHVYAPGTALQASDFPAEDKAAPAVAEILVICAGV